LLLSEVETESESDSSTEENSDVSTDSESSESETEFFRKKKKANEPKVKKEVKKSLKTAKGNAKEVKTKTSSKDKKAGIMSPEPMDEMEGLIKRMNAISLDDPDYALYYYRATRIDPTIKEMIAAPILKRGNNNQANYKPNNTQNGQGNVRQNDNRNPNYKGPPPGTRFYNPPNTPFNERTCFGCGEKGHGIPVCPQVNKLISDVLEALNREDKVPVTHFIKVNSGGTQSHSARKEIKSKESRTAYIEDYLSEDEETDTEDEAYAFPVERVTRNSTQGRQERFKEVFPHGQSKNLRKSNEKDKGKDKVPTTQAKPKSTQPTPVTKTKPVNKRDVGPSQEKSWDSDDIVMDDVDDRKATEKRMKYNDSPFKPTLNPDRKTTTTRQRVSDIAAKIKPEKILETVLRTPIRLEVDHGSEATTFP
ncbi:hypothetical protein P692DRAFT_201812621, partial [Suillus brevipes Sb2]